MTQSGLRAYAVVTAAYWCFMLTDGAMRMLVLLHFHMIGFSPVQLAYLFILYEIAGIVTNFLAGWAAARFGLASTLYAGLSLQILGLLMLTQLDPGWTIAVSVAFAMLAQGLSGVAKDLTKMSSKSAVKHLAPSAGDGLFRWVAILTGSKNAIKGLGFFLGAVLLGVLGFVPAILAMAAVLFAVLIGVIFGMPKGLPQGKKAAKLSQVWAKDAAINRLSVARVFLFGARDVWFVVGIPIYFYAVLSDGSEAGNRTAFFQIGGFMALWIILYGAVQSAAPKILRAAERSQSEIVSAAKWWAAALVPMPFLLAFAVWVASPSAGLTALLVLGLLAFGAIFAVNSAIHSYLILAFSSASRVTMDVGFYYMANASGRLLGTLLSGLTYQIGGLPMTLTVSGLMLLLSWIATRRLPDLAR